MQRTFMTSRKPVPELAATDVAAVLVKLIGKGPDGRTGDEVYLWAGHPAALPATRTIPVESSMLDEAIPADEGQVAIVTGAWSSLGLTAARRLATDGFAVVCVDADGDAA